MITIDASAILAILLKEADADIFRARILEAGGGVVSPVNYWEVLSRMWVRFGPAGTDTTELAMTGLGVDVVTITPDDARRAARAFERFGKRSGGRLNLGDCFAYALAAKEGEGLLFKGDDFPKTDVKSALA